MYYKNSVTTFVVIMIATCMSAQSDSTGSMKVYLNCQWCYQDYLRTQITWVNFVQDQFVSDVDLMVTGLETGSGGIEYQLIFSGKKGMAGMNDTIKFSVNAIQTDNEQREILARKVKLGLVRYAACSATGDCLIIDSNSKQDSLDVGIGSNPQEDPWNAWVFNVGGNTNMSAVRVSQEINGGAQFSASQIKESHKLLLYAYASYSEQRIKLSQEKMFVLRTQSAYASYVKSINNHWSTGLFTSAERNDRRNYDRFQSLTGAVEYNLIPYSEAQTRIIVFSYRVGYNFYDFQEVTIYNKTKDAIPFQSLNASASFTKDWGSLSAGIEAAAFINDFSKNHLNFRFDNSIRIFKGLTLNSSIYYGVVNDQVNIRLSGASEEQVLLQQQELLTNYEFNAYMSLNYRFGSIYNNVVNPRFNY